MKSQFGPDATIGMILLLVLTIGGVFFIHMFVSGFSVQSLISIVDKESNEECTYLVNNIASGEFVRSGDTNTSSYPPTLKETYTFFGGHSNAMDVNFGCEKKVQEFQQLINTINNGESTEFNQYKNMISGVTGVCANQNYYNHVSSSLKINNYLICYDTVYLYNPFGPAGVAEVNLFGSGVKQ